MDGVDWLRVGPDRETTVVPKIFQDDEFDLAPGDQVLLAGDRFLDVHADVLEIRETGWVVPLYWDVWDR